MAKRRRKVKVVASLQAIDIRTTPIDRGIPIPEIRAAYPWEQMKVGDSFMLRNKSEGSAYSSAKAASARLGRTFVAKKTETGIRVWRVA